MSQIRVLSELVKVLVPLKEEHDHQREQAAASRESVEETLSRNRQLAHDRDPSRSAN